MAKNKVEVSIQEEIRNVTRAMKRVTKAVFDGQPGVAPTIRGKRKSVQVTFKMNNANDKRSLQSQARRQILAEIFSKRATQVEQALKNAIEQVLAGLIGAGGGSVRVMGRSLGSAKPARKLEQEPFARFIKSKEGAGEIGLPDPSEALRNLKFALLAAITVDVVVRKDGPQIKFVFDQNRLLKRTPHPHRMENGVQGPFFSWLSLVTGPDFARSGTPGYSLIRVSDLRNTLNRSAKSGESRQASYNNLRRANITEGLIRVSRTRSYAGALAGIMLGNKTTRGGKSAAEAFGGKTEDYRPSPRFNGFWDEWWMRNKLELSIWARKIMSATARALLRG